MDEAEASPSCENYPEAFYPDKGGTTLPAKSLCAGCPIQKECLDYGIKWEVHGIWGGVAGRDRLKMRQELQRRGVKLPDLDSDAA